MKFGVYLEENLIPEWRDFYINFELLKQKIKPFLKKYKKKSNLIFTKRNGNYKNVFINNS